MDRKPWKGEHPTGELLSSYVDGEIEVGETESIVAHLETCGACRTCVASFQGLRATLRVETAHRVPTSLHRDVWRRIDARQAQDRAPFRIPSLNVVVGYLANGFAVAIIAVLAVIIAPGVSAIWQQLGQNVPVEQSSSAAQPTLIAPLATATANPTATAPAPEPTAFPATAPAPIATPNAVRPTIVVEQTPRLPAVEATRAPLIATVVPASPIATHTPVSVPIIRAISGKVTFVDRKQRTMTVSSDANGADRQWSISLFEGTQFSRADGRKTQFEDVGIADQVEISGFDSTGGSNYIMASTLRIAVSAVAVANASTPRTPRILVLVDGAENLRAGQYGFTGDWARHLSGTGFDVTTADPSRVSWLNSPLQDFAVVVIGNPATLTNAAISAIRGSKLPLLVGDPRLVSVFGLGANVDPSSPSKQAPPGRSMDISASSSGTTRGLPVGEIVLARELVFRTPIISNGTVLATVTDGGQRRAVWTQSGSAIYLGVWNSASGSNHTDAYWNIIDRSILALLGREIPVPSPAVTPTVQRTRS